MYVCVFLCIDLFFSNRNENFLLNHIEKKNVAIIFFSFSYCDNPNNLSALKAVAKATSSGFLPIKAAIISTIAGKLQGSFR